MDVKDRKLLYLLDLNSRMKESDIAKQLGTSKQVVNYRIKRLGSEGIIKKFQSVLNLESLGVNIYANVYFKIVGADKKKEEEIVDYLVKSESVGYVALLGGRFDISIVLVSRDIQELEESLNKIVNEFPNELKEHSIALRTIGLKFQKKYLFQQKSEENKSILTKEKHLIKIDDLDVKILRELSKNSRESIVTISEKVKEPFSTIRTRIRNLEQRKVIAGYSILFDLSKIGILNYKVLIKTKDKSEDFYRRIISFSKSHKNITWFFKTLGEHDFELRVEVENQERYQEILKEIRSEFASSVDEIETIIVFHEAKEDYSIVLSRKE